MTPQELKNSILQLAIQGKLVEQRAEEGTGNELLEKILAAKNAKDAEKGKGKSHAKSAKSAKCSGSQFSPISDDEKPFDIPDSWEWVRLGDVATIERGVGIKRSETTDKGFPCVRYGEIYTAYGISFTQTQSFIPASVAEKCRKANFGDILCTLTGEWKEEIAKATAYLGKEPIAIGGDLAKISTQGYNSALLVFFFFSPFMISQKAAKANGNIIVHIGKEAVSNLIIPLPPLAEQKRIVAKIEELLPLIDRYEKAWSRLESFNKSFPVDMQKSILQMAIQGKLVEQRAEEGTGRELLEKILAAKNVEGAKGRGEKSHAKSAKSAKSAKVGSRVSREEIPDDEKPFDIPESWEWVRLCEIAQSIVDCPHSTPKYISTASLHCAIDTNCIDEKGTIVKWRYVDATTYQTRVARLVPQEDDIVYTREGSICRAAILPTRKKVCLGQRVMLVRCAKGVHPLFLRQMLMTPMVISRLTGQQKGIGAKHVNVSDVCSLTLPLPPLAEQKRIVAKLEELLPLCERLK